MISTDQIQNPDLNGFKKASQLINKDDHYHENSTSNSYDRTEFFKSSKRKYDPDPEPGYEPENKLVFPFETLKGQTLRQRDKSVSRLIEFMKSNNRNNYNDEE